MQISSLFVGFALLVAAVAYVSRPFFEKPRSGAKATPKVGDARTRDAVLSALRDLDFDFKTGKIVEEDYQPLRAQLLLQAAQLMNAEKKEEEQLESLIQSRRNSRKAACPTCGKKLVLGDAFCSSCGSKLEIRVEAVTQP
jgi:hypothetical protein